MRILFRIRSLCLAALAVLVLASIYSCSEDAVINNNSTEYSFDSARFNWSIDTINMYCIEDMYIADTSNIYFLNIDDYAMVRYSNGNYVTFDPGSDILPTTIDGFDNNNIFVGGLEDLGSSIYKAKLKKWNGGTFEDIPLNIEPGYLHYVSMVKVISGSEIWIGTTKGKILHYDQNLFQSYTLNPLYSILPGQGFLKTSHFVYSIVAKYIDTSQSTIDSMLILKFTNNEWRLVYSMSGTFRNIRVVDDEIYALGINDIFKMNSNSFVLVLSPPAGFYPYWSFGGNTLNNLCEYGYLQINNQHGQKCLLNWNGKKWSREIYNSSFGVNDIQFIQDKFFGIYSDASYETYLITGKGKREM